VYHGVPYAFNKIGYYLKKKKKIKKKKKKKKKKTLEKALAISVLSSQND
jgi:hypothetical protein